MCVDSTAAVNRWGRHWKEGRGLGDQEILFRVFLVVSRRHVNMQTVVVVKSASGKIITPFDERADNIVGVEIPYRHFMHFGLKEDKR